MKKPIIITIALFLTASLFTSCKTDKGDNPDRLTARGMTMTDEWSNITDAVLMRFADITFKLNHYIETGQYNADGNGMYLQQSSFDNVWEVYNYKDGEVAYIINTYGQPLDHIGTRWELTSFTDYYRDFGLRQDDCTVNFTITCIDENSWNFYSMNDDIPEYFFDVDIRCKDTPNTLDNHAFALSGKGNLCFNDYYEDRTSYYSDYRDIGPDYGYPSFDGKIDISFETESDLQKTPEYWSKGAVNIIASNIEEKTSSTRAEFSRKGYEYIVKITYGGVTEEWYPFLNYYYY